MSRGSAPAPPNRIDTIKGIGILCVVVGHIFEGPVIDVIYIFHMPLFFFVSGYLFKQKPIRSFLRQKLVHLILPYVTYLTLYTTPAAISLVRHIVATGHVGRFAAPLAKAIYGGATLTGATRALWFVSCLFLTQQVYNALMGVGSRWLHVTMATSYLLAVANTLMPQADPFPLAVNVCLMAAPILHLGTLYRRCEDTLRRVRIQTGLLAVFCAGVAMEWTAFNLAMDMKLSDYGVPVLSTLVALACIGLVFRGAEWIDQFAISRATLGRLGQASMTVVFTHEFFHLVIAPRLDLTDPTLVLFFSLAGALLVHGLATRFRLTRCLLLGSIDDFEALRHALSSRSRARVM